MNCCKTLKVTESTVRGLSTNLGSWLACYCCAANSYFWTARSCCDVRSRNANNPHEATTLYLSDETKRALELPDDLVARGFALNGHVLTSGAVYGTSLI